MKSIGVDVLQAISSLYLAQCITPEEKNELARMVTIAMRIEGYYPVIVNRLEEIRTAKKLENNEEFENIIIELKNKLEGNNL